MEELRGRNLPALGLRSPGHSHDDLVSVVSRRWKPRDRD